MKAFPSTWRAAHGCTRGKPRQVSSRWPRRGRAAGREGSAPAGMESDCRGVVGAPAGAGTAHAGPNPDCARSDPGGSPEHQAGRGGVCGRPSCALRGRCVLHCGWRAARPCAPPGLPLGLPRPRLTAPQGGSAAGVAAWRRGSSSFCELCGVRVGGCSSSPTMSSCPSSSPHPDDGDGRRVLTAGREGADRRLGEARAHALPRHCVILLAAQTCCYGTNTRHRYLGSSKHQLSAGRSSSLHVPYRDTIDGRVVQAA